MQFTLSYLGSNVVSNHELLSLTEIISLVDSRNSRDIRSSPIEYVNTSIDVSSRFKKVETENVRCYTADEEDGFYEMLYTNVLRFKYRLNGVRLCLAEVAIFYDFVGNETSGELFKLYQGNIDNIKNSDVTSSCGSNYLPEYILSSNEQVMKIRKHRKVLKIPKYNYGSFKYKYSKVLLFYPIEPGAEIDVDEVGKY